MKIVKDGREVEFWSSREDDEQLCYTDVEDAFDEFYQDNGTDAIAGPVPIYGFARRQFTDRDKLRITGRLTEHLSICLGEEFGPWDDEPTIPESALSLCEQIADSLQRDFVPYHCEKIVTVQCDAAGVVRDWGGATVTDDTDSQSTLSTPDIASRGCEEER